MIEESRVLNGVTTLYSYSYLYDQLGNRLLKSDNVNEDLHTVYYYDACDDEGECDGLYRDPDYETKNNRLVKYEEWDGETLLRTVRYVHYVTGDVSNIIIKDESGTDSQYYYDLAMYYTKDGKLWRALWDRWTLDGGGEVDAYNTIAAREFYYDADGARYMSRIVDPDSWEATTAAQSWTDYNGLLPYQDFSVTVDVTGEECLDCPEPVEKRRYLDGMTARQDLDSEGDPLTEFYMHGDLIGSVNVLTDNEGDPVNVADGGVSGTDPSPVVCYTAFGERVVYASSTVTIGGDLPAEFARAGYSGQTGYESGFLKLQGPNANLPPITLQHLGQRWYQPGIGRFVQRDPCGISPGLNLYLYCEASPVAANDPTGTTSSFARHKAGWAAIRWLLGEARPSEPIFPKLPPYPSSHEPSPKQRLKGLGVLLCVVAGLLSGPIGWVAGIGSGLWGVDELGDVFYPTRREWEAPPWGNPPRY